MISFIMVALGGMSGALSRFFVHKTMPAKVLPVATLAVNLLGSFLLGWIVGNGIQGHLYLFAAIGFMGAFTTFSTLNVELVKLLSSGQTKAAFAYFLSTYIGGLFFAVIGLLLGRLI